MSSLSRKRSKPSSSRTRRRQGAGGGGASTGWKRNGTALPGWTDLEPKTNRRVRQDGDASGSFLQRVSTIRFAALILGVAVLFTLYVGHVHATQQLLADLQDARTLNHKLHLKHNRLKGEFDHATGPSVIYDRARQMGLEESVSYGPVITLDN